MASIAAGNSGMVLFVQWTEYPATPPPGALVAPGSTLGRRLLSSARLQAGNFPARDFSASARVFEAWRATWTNTGRDGKGPARAADRRSCGGAYRRRNRLGGRLLRYGSGVPFAFAPSRPNGAKPFSPKSFFPRLGNTGNPGLKRPAAPSARKYQPLAAAGAPTADNQPRSGWAAETRVACLPPGVQLTRYLTGRGPFCTSCLVWAGIRPWGLSYTYAAGLGCWRFFKPAKRRQNKLRAGLGEPDFSALRRVQQRESS